jgi:hypothetical protein
MPLIGIRSRFKELAVTVEVLAQTPKAHSSTS